MDLAHPKFRRVLLGVTAKSSMQDQAERSVSTDDQQTISCPLVGTAQSAPLPTLRFL